MDNVVEFRCVPEKPVYIASDYKVYGCSVNSYEYPDIKIGRYGTVTIKGNISELYLGIDYLVKAKKNEKKNT